MLIVEDEALVALDLEERLVRMGHRVVGVCADGPSALRSAAQTSPDVVLMDIHLRGELDGIEVARRLGEGPSIPVVFLTGNADDATVQRATDAKPFGFLLKPFDPRELQAVVATASQRSRAEQSLRTAFEAQRLESLCVLAGGIAHDFNNLLTVVLGNVALVRADEVLSDSASESLGEVERAARSAADLCQQMLAYAGKAVVVPSEFDLSRLAAETVERMRASIARHVQIRLELAPVLPRIHADRAQLQQLLVNLVANAAEALGERAGIVTVATSLEEPSAEELARAVVAPTSTASGPLVVLEVGDDGPGLDASTLRSAFDPFFTTKLSGRGLGLAFVAGVLRRHGAGLVVSSAPGAGATFRVLVPVAERSGAPSLEVATRGPLGAPTDPLVLVVDDDVSVLRVTQKMLVTEGFETAIASGGAAALEIVAAEAERLCLVLLDLTMPGLDGVATLERLRVIAPDLPVLLMSGYTEATAELRVKFDARTRFVAKPFTPTALRAAVDELLGVATLSR